MNLEYSDDTMEEIFNFWANELSEFAVEDIRAIYPKIKDQQYPPSLSDVIAWLKPKLNYEQLFKEAANGTFYLRAVYEAVQQYGQFDIRRDNYDKAKVRWKGLLDQCFLNYGKALYIAPPLLQIKKNEPLPMDKIHAIRQKMDDILENAQNNPNKDWAHRLKAKFDAGEKLSQCQIDCMCEALELDQVELRKKHAKPAKNATQPVSRKDRVLVD